MKNFKKITGLLCGILLLVACSKKDNPEPAQQDIDLTQYYVAGKMATTEFGKMVTEPYAILIKPNAGALFLNAGGEINSSYTYKNGHLVFALINGQFILDFTINNNVITEFNSSGSVITTLTSSSLEKIPSANTFTGLFKGSLSTTANLQPIAPYLLFTNSQYGFGINTGPAVNLNYTLQNNGVAINNTGTITRSLFVMINGKLEIGRYVPVTSTSPGGLDYGTYIKQ